MQGLLAAVDGHSLMHRAFYALPPMNAPTGEFTNAVFGFLNMFLKALDSLSPTHVLVVFDRHEPTFRTKEYAEYKAHRKPMPDDLRQQFPILRDALKAMGIAVYDQAGLEADDLLGIYACMAENEGMKAVLISGDRDILQLVSNDVSVMLTKRGVQETIMYDPARIRDDYGLSPRQLIDVKALMGDASDNIPGVPGIGEKSALLLVSQYGSLEDALSHADEIKGKLGERLREHAETARMSRRLAEIVCEHSVECSIADCAFDKSAMGGARDLFAALGFRSLLGRLPKSAAPEKRPDASKEIQWREIRCESAAQLAEALEGAGEGFALEANDSALTIAFGETLVTAAFGGTLLEPGLAPEDAFAALKPLLESSAPKTLFDVKRWRHYLDKQGVALATPARDVMLQAYLLNANESGVTLASLVQAAFGADAAPDAARLMALSDSQRAEMAGKGLDKLYDEIEAPLTGVLYEMERIGFLADPGALKELGAQYAEKLSGLEAEIHALAGAPFSILSPKQLGAVLFEKLGLTASKKTKTGYSTDQEALEALIPLHPIAGKVLEYRQLSKLNSTYVIGLLHAIAKDGRIHTAFQQAVTATGRISSTEPNLQNIPVRTQLGREIRRAFVAKEGYTLISADYSQIELRVLAHMSGDEAMRRAFFEDGDFHTHTAGEVFGVPEELVTSEQRSAAKAVNFGIVYGISDFGLARNLGIPRKQAADYIGRYFETYPGVKRYMTDAVAKAKEKGYAETMFGRRRAMPELNSSNYNVRGFGERVAMNMPIQGSAADIIKLAMIRVFEKLRDSETRLILQVHDELVLEAPEKDAEQAARLLKETMEGVAEMSVPLIVSCEMGRDWLHMNSIRI